MVPNFQDFDFRKPPIPGGFFTNESDLSFIIGHCLVFHKLYVSIVCFEIR